MDSGFGLAYHAVDGMHVTERSQATAQPYITIENNIDQAVTHHSLGILNKTQTNTVNL